MLPCGSPRRFRLSFAIVTLCRSREGRLENNYHDPSIAVEKPELVSKYLEPLKDPLWDRGLLHFYRSLQVGLIAVAGAGRLVVPAWPVHCQIRPRPASDGMR